MLNQLDFLKKYNISEDEFNNTKLDWDELKKIYEDYLIFKEELEPTAIMLFNKLMKSPKVHSVRYRIKDPEHLIEKIIRKKVEDEMSNITFENYKEKITDLIGLRALHLFKEEWEYVNDFITNKWDLKQPPVANYRKGDSEQFIDIFKKKGCEPKEHKYGYRSIHYLIKTKPGKQFHYGEIQVRTIFEEAWAEIDHTIRYPYDLENPIFFQFLLILNRLSGSADEMGSFIQFLKGRLEARENEFNIQMKEKERLISDLESKIEKTNLQEAEIKELKEDIKKLREQKISSYPYINVDGKNDGMLSSISNFSEIFSTTNIMKQIYTPILSPISGTILDIGQIYTPTDKKEDQNTIKKTKKSKK